MDNNDDLYAPDHPDHIDQLNPHDVGVYVGRLIRKSIGKALYYAFATVCTTFVLYTFFGFTNSIWSNLLQ